MFTGMLCSQGKLGMPGRLFVILAFCFQPLAAQKLTHGPIVGGVTSSSARFYVRIDTTAEVNIQLTDFTTVIQGTPQVVAASNDFAALIRADGLMANTLYYYRVTVNGRPAGEVRQFQTFPAPGDRQPFVFTFGSCQQAEPWQGSNSAGRVFKAMARDLPRFFLQIGDWGYPDTTDAESGDPTDFFSLEMSRVQESYRAKYDSTYPAQEVLRIAPVDYVYDDHDYTNNNSSAFTTNDLQQRIEIPVPPEARLNTIRGYQQLFPGYPLVNPNGGIWHKFTFGNADFFMLDLRAQRSPNMEALRLNPDNGKFEFAPRPGHSILAGDSTLVGENQRDWLLRELRDSPADWKFIISSVPFNRGLHQPLDLALHLQPVTIPVPGFGSVSTLLLALGLVDSWAGFPGDQELLLKFLNDNEIKNVIVLSGDSHTAGMDDGQNAGLPEVMAAALDRDNSFMVAIFEVLGMPIWNLGGQTVENKNFFDAYGRITVLGAESVRLEIVDEFGTVLASHIVHSQTTAVASNAPGPIAEFTLSPNYPNPLRVASSHEQTTVRYTLPNRALVRAKIYDLMGRVVRQWQEQWQSAGEHALRWDGKNDGGEALPSGVYRLAVELDFQNGQRQKAAQEIVIVK